MEELPADYLRDAENEMPVGNLFEHLGTQSFPTFHDPLLIAGRAKMTTLAGEDQKISLLGHA